MYDTLSALKYLVAASRGGFTTSDDVIPRHELPIMNQGLMSFYQGVYGEERMTYFVDRMRRLHHIRTRMKDLRCRLPRDMQDTVFFGIIESLVATNLGVGECGESVHRLLFDMMDHVGQDFVADHVFVCGIKFEHSFPDFSVRTHDGTGWIMPDYKHEFMLYASNSAAFGYVRRSMDKRHPGDIDFLPWLRAIPDDIKGQIYLVDPFLKCVAQLNDLENLKPFFDYIIAHVRALSSRDGALGFEDGVLRHDDGAGAGALDLDAVKVCVDHVRAVRTGFSSRLWASKDDVRDIAMRIVQSCMTNLVSSVYDGRHTRRRVRDTSLLLQLNTIYDGMLHFEGWVDEGYSLDVACVIDTPDKLEAAERLKADLGKGHFYYEVSSGSNLFVIIGVNKLECSSEIESWIFAALDERSSSAASASAGLSS